MTNGETGASNRGTWVHRLLPHGATLSEEAWRTRHRILVLVLVCHLPALVFIPVFGALPVPILLAWLAPLAGLALTGIAPLPRVVRALAVAGGLVGCSLLLLHASGGQPEAYFHALVVLGLVAFYQDWRPFLVVVAALVVNQAAASLLAPTSALAEAFADRAWRWTPGNSLLLAVVAATYVAFWKLAEREQERAAALRRQLEEGEEAILEQLREAEEVKRQLVAVISHEFRTPLTAIIGVAQTLTARLESLEPQAVRAFLRSIDEQARHLGAIVHNVLAVSGEVDVDRSAITDLASIAQEVADEVTIASEHPPVIHVGVSPPLPAHITSEAAHRVLTNLLENAAKFAEPGTVVGVRSLPRREAAVLEISNTGPPLLPEVRRRIFEPFVQADSSDTRQAGGVGLGLHVVRLLVEAHGGRIATRHEGGRVVFVITIPAPPQDDSALVLLEEDEQVPDHA